MVFLTIVCWYFHGSFQVNSQMFQENILLIHSLDESEFISIARVDKGEGRKMEFTYEISISMRIHSTHT